MHRSSNLCFERQPRTKQQSLPTKTPLRTHSHAAWTFTMFTSPFALLVALGLLPQLLAQTTLKSPADPNVTISWRVPETGTCTTVFDSQKQYSGYVHLPPFTLAPIQQNYSINTFFWFVESRQSPETAPLTIWLNGGPGSSSMLGFFQENGPCEVVQLSDGTYGTQSRMWGWDRISNVLFIDQPNQVGFSYDTPTNFSVDMIHGIARGPFNSCASRLTLPGTYNPPGPVPSGIPSFAYLNGTLPTQSPSFTANTTQIAAHAMYHFLQGWLSAFPQYNPGVRPNNSDTGPAEVNLFVESYGGQYGPVFAYYLEQMNELRANGTLPNNNTLEISLASLGIVNGLIDVKTQTSYYPKFAANNSYGIQGITQLSMYNTMTAFGEPGGCADLVGTLNFQVHFQIATWTVFCQEISGNLTSDLWLEISCTFLGFPAVWLLLNPLLILSYLDQCRTGQSMNSYGDSSAVDMICSNAVTQCTAIENVFSYSGLSFYDIRQQFPPPFPSEAYLEYLNSGQVMQSLGVPVNYTESSNAVFNNFIATGDEINYVLPDLAALLGMNIRVALIYGDADYICNWYVMAGNLSMFRDHYLLLEMHRTCSISWLDLDNSGLFTDFNLGMEAKPSPFSWLPSPLFPTRLASLPPATLS